MRERIQETAGKIKGLLAAPGLFPVLLIILVGFTSFGLGRLAERGTGILPAGTPAGTQSAAIGQGATEEAALPVARGYVASRNGAKYHLPWCSGAERILEENEVWFDTEEEARAAGYEPAANCRGL